MRIGIYGGSFDPVHQGHLLLAEQAREACRLDQVWFVPSARAPHKLHLTPAAAEHRVEMLRLATGGHPAFVVSTIELEMAEGEGDVSYTYRTLENVADRHPQAELFLLLGGDSLHDLPQWREPGRICELSTLAAVRRHGSPEPDYDALARFVPPARLEQMRQATIEMPRIEISSSDIRRRVAAGRSIRYMTPRAVEIYIHEHRLYGAPSETAPSESPE